jgi:hypothetical protein
MPRQPEPFTIEGRFLVGRVFKAVEWVRNDDELDAVIERMVKAFIRDDDSKELWGIYVLLIRNDLRWIEQLLQIDPDKIADRWPQRKDNQPPTLDETVGFVREQLVETMERMRGGNSAALLKAKTFACPQCGDPDADEDGCRVCGSGPSG